MIAILSPAKTMDFESKIPAFDTSKPRFEKQSQVLVNKLKKYSINRLMSLMDISKDLAELNHERFQHWRIPSEAKNARPSIFAFRGEVYNGFDVDTLKKKDVEFAQEHLRIISGLYGLLRPLDQILPYRLEMGLSLKIGKHDSLYSFWESMISDELLKDIEKQGDDTLINLASMEYFKAVKKASKHTHVVTPVFKEKKGGQYKVIAVYAKNARGRMARFICRERIKEADHLKSFSEDGYIFNNQLSNDNTWTFTRG